MKVYHGLMKALRAVVTLILAAVVIIVALQVFFRYVLKSPLGWSEQICRLLFIWAIMIGIPLVFYEKCDLVFDIIFQKFKPGTQHVLSIVFTVLTLAFSVFYFICGMDLCLKSVGRMTTGIRMPINMLYGAQPACAVLLFIVFTERLVSLLKKKDTEKEEKE
jgi:TRAP-type C4-dicarboxylate transport system permease small subunit